MTILGLAQCTFFYFLPDICPIASLVGLILSSQLITFISLQIFSRIPLSLGGRSRPKGCHVLVQQRQDL